LTWLSCETGRLLTSDGRSTRIRTERLVRSLTHGQETG
jgi:hypothetical protein